MVMLSVNKRSIKTFQERLKTIQYNAALAITEALRKICLFCKIYKNQCLQYLDELLLQRSRCYQTRQSISVPLFRFKHSIFSN